jgi:hypothetical protein
MSHRGNLNSSLVLTAAPAARPVDYSRFLNCLPPDLKPVVGR